MPDLRQQLEILLHGRVAFIGLGNVDYGDDGFGVHLAQSLQEAGVPDVVLAANMPERFIGPVVDAGFDCVIFLDAVEFGGAAGSVVLLNSSEMTTRFPQVSTHKISLGLLAKWVESNGSTRVWLLGVQPESLAEGSEISPVLQTTLDALADLLCGIVAANKGAEVPHSWGTEEARV